MFNPLIRKAMLKKLLLLYISLLCVTTLSAQKDSIPLNAGYFDPYEGLGGHPRGPVDPPTVYLENYTLTFAANHPEYVLYIKDENETVVYSTVVTSAATEVVLPSTLSGNYEINLVMNEWYFWGHIEL